MMAEQKEENRIIIEKHLKQISQEEYDVYRAEAESVQQMNHESRQLQEQI